VVSGKWGGRGVCVGIQTHFKDAHEDAAGWGGGPICPSVPQSLEIVGVSS